MRVQQQQPSTSTVDMPLTTMLPADNSSRRCRHRSQRLHHIRPADIFISIDSPPSETPSSSSSSSSSASVTSCRSTTGLVAASKTETAATAGTTVAVPEPLYLNLDKGKKPVFYHEKEPMDDDIMAEEAGADWPLMGSSSGLGGMMLPPLRSAPPVVTSRWRQTKGYSLDYSIMDAYSPDSYCTDNYVIIF
jgi:hypothetical protein